MTTVVKIDHVLTEEEEQIFIAGRRAAKLEIDREASDAITAARFKGDEAKRVEDKAYYQGVAEAWAHVRRLCS